MPPTPRPGPRPHVTSEEVHAVRHPLRGRHLAVLVVGVTAGLVLVASAVTAKGTDLRAGSRTDLESLIQAGERRGDASQAQVDRARAEVDALRAGTSQGEQALLDAQAAALAPSTGLAPITGPGIRVTLDDAPSGRLFALLVCLGSLVELAVAQSPSTAQRTCSAQQKTQRAASPQQVLALGIYYYNNDDLSGRAEQSFRELLTSKYAGTEEAESAQYFLASYYQRKFYIQRAKWRRDDWDSLKQAVVEYRHYTDKSMTIQEPQSGSPTRFLTSRLFSMQLNDNGNAFRRAFQIKSAAVRDSTIYVYQIIFSPQSKDVIDAFLPATRLADMTLSLLSNRQSYFDARIALLTQWCRDRKRSPTKPVILPGNFWRFLLPCSCSCAPLTGIPNL